MQKIKSHIKTKIMSHIKTNLSKCFCVIVHLPAIAVYLNKFSYKIGLFSGGAFAEHAQTKTSHSSVVVRKLKLGFKSLVPDHLWLIHAAPMTSGLRGLA